MPLKGQTNGPEISTTLAPIKNRKFCFFSNKTMIRKTLLKDKVIKKLAIEVIYGRWGHTVYQV